MRILRFILLSLMLISCSGDNSSQTFDLQGHRGARGLMPENTIPGFLKAVDLGVHTVELDVVVTADDHILVSHEPWFHHDISTKPDGTPVTEEEEKELNIYEMTSEETRRFDVGMRAHPQFPDQEKMNVSKPLLEEAIRAVENYTDGQELAPVRYNIEMKSNPEYYGVFVPQPEEFARLLNTLLMGLDEEFELEERIIIQSFDLNALIEFREVNPDVKLAMLVSDHRSIEHIVDTLGFTPDIWSPNYQLVTPELVSEAHEHGMKVIPWTVNTTEEMQRLIDLGVDGIITDYPDRAVR